MIVSLDHIYYVAAVFLAVIAFMSLRDRANPRRYATALFWGLYAVTFGFGGLIPAPIMGVVVIALAVIAGFGGVRRGAYKETTETGKLADANRLGNWLFFPALLIPAVTILGSLAARDIALNGVPLLDPKNVTIVSLGVACLVALAAALLVACETPVQSLREGRRLLDSIGWAALLPQALATLGGVFAAAGVGQAVSDVVTGAIPMDNKFFVVAAYAVGMALFTMIMGNAFAAFPVMTVGIALPFLIHRHGADPAVVAAIGMYSGYCGTLMTPMAANFNIVPAALLDLPGKNGVIRVQVATAIPLLTVNVFLMYFLAFR